VIERDLTACHEAGHAVAAMMRGGGTVVSVTITESELTGMGIEEPTTWESYEDVARYLLEKLSDKLGLGLERVEGKQKLVGKSGMVWEVDAKGVKTGEGAIVVIECRRYTSSKVKPEAVGGLAYRISDVGASGGILVTPIGVQQGGQLIADDAGIQIVHLDADSTLTTVYLLRFLDTVICRPRWGDADTYGRRSQRQRQPSRTNERSPHRSAPGGHYVAGSAATVTS
jgi:Restriction endonuclease